MKNVIKNCLWQKIYIVIKKIIIYLKKYIYKCIINVVLHLLWVVCLSFVFGAALKWDFCYQVCAMCVCFSTTANVPKRCSCIFKKLHIACVYMCVSVCVSVHKSILKLAEVYSDARTTTKHRRGWPTSRVKTLSGTSLGLSLSHSLSVSLGLSLSLSPHNVPMSKFNVFLFWLGQLCISAK